MLIFLPQGVLLIGVTVIDRALSRHRDHKPESVNNVCRPFYAIAASTNTSFNERVKVIRLVVKDHCTSDLSKGGNQHGLRFVLCIVKENATQNVIIVIHIVL